MNMNTEAQAQSTENARPNGRREERRPNRAEQRTDRRVNRSATEVMQYLPVGWSATVHELDPGGTKDARVRLRVLVFESSDKGFKILPFFTVRVPRRMKTEAGDVEMIDDMDILPHNPLEGALPAILFDHGNVLEELCVLLGDFSKRQAALPPPSKRPLTQRPFAEGLAKVARQNAKERAQQVATQQPPVRVERQDAPPAQQGGGKRKRNRGRKHDLSVVLLMPLL